MSDASVGRHDKSSGAGDKGRTRTRAPSNVRIFNGGAEGTSERGQLQAVPLPRDGIGHRSRSVVHAVAQPLLATNPGTKRAGSSADAADWWRPRPERCVPRHLTGNVAVVTGASRGFGLEVSRVLLAEGMKVVLGDLDGREVAAAATGLAAAGAEVAYEEVNPCILDDVEALRDAALATFGSVDLWCHAGGYGVRQGFLDHTSSLWSDTFDLNVRSLVNGLRAFLPMMVEQDEGHVMAVAAQDSIAGEPYLAAYAACQLAIVAIMESVARERAAESSAVTASVVCTGPVDPESEVSGPHEAREAVKQMKSGRFWVLPQRERTEQLFRHRLEALLDGGRLADLQHTTRLN
jgi:NAD(P)-dependent dehydrogenase (short-subunit alcohol dehydrogenase family)